MWDSLLRLYCAVRVLEALAVLEAMQRCLLSPPPRVTVAYGDYRATVCRYDITPQLEAMLTARCQLSLFSEVG